MGEYRITRWVMKKKSAVTIFVLFCFGGDMIGEEDKDQNSGNPRKKEASKDQKRDRRLTSLKKKKKHGSNQKVPYQLWFLFF